MKWKKSVQKCTNEVTTENKNHEKIVEVKIKRKEIQKILKRMKRNLVQIGACDIANYVGDTYNCL